MCSVRGAEGVCSADLGVSAPGYSAAGKKCEYMGQLRMVLSHDMDMIW